MLQHITAITGILLAAAVFLVLHKDSITLRITRTFNHSLSTLFNILKEPGYLSELNSNVRSVSISERREDDGGVEYKRFSVSESFHHIGVYNVTGTLVSDVRNYLIAIQYSALGGILKSDITYLLSADYTDITSGSHVTTISEVCTLTFPWILKNFVNRTSYEMHNLMFDYLEAIAATNEADR